MPIDRTLKLSTGLAPAAAPQAAAVSGHLWDLMKAASQDRGEFHRAWLALQCGMIAGATAGLLLTREAAKHGEPARYVPQASWPDANRELTHLAQIAERAAGEGRTIVAWARHEGAVQALASAIVAHPIGSGIEGPLAIAAVIVAPRTAVVDPQAVARQLHWGGGWLEMLIARAEAQQSKAQLARAGAGLDLLAVAGGHLDLSAAAMAIANELADRLDCDRVSIGLINRRRNAVHLRAMSRSAIVKRTTRLAESIEDAMEEALDQQSPIAYPLEAETEGRIVLAHKELARAAGDRAAILSVPLQSQGKPSGVITLERHRDEPFDRDSLRLCEAAAELLGPFFDLLYRDDRWVSGRAIRTAGAAVQAIRDPRRPTFKLAAAAAVVLMAVLFFAKGEHRVSAKSVTEGLIQRAAVAPFDGFVRTAPARAGDTVRAHDLLATMDDRDLRLEKLRWVSEVEKATQKYREALAKHDRAEMMLAAAQVDQAQAQLALAKDRLERVQIRAPFDSVVVSGDLSQALGSPVEKGKVLFEIAPLDQYRVILQVDERDIPYVEQGEAGTLTLTGLPAQPVAFHVTKVTPVASSEDGRNFFRVEATLDGPKAQLRPGMEGVAKLDAGRRNLIWIWTHPLIDWIRLMSWKWLP